MPARTRAGAPVAERVIAWQRRHGRHDLPWQTSRDPYRVWLSEIMLQQTQVATVLDYYPRFLERFPDVRTLAAAPLDDVLALWSGLGYYSRARHLHRCAQAIVAGHGGSFPRSAAALAELPGIGRSTAGAIAAFCFGERAAILDGNVKRVLTRVLGFDADLARAANERVLWQHAEALLPARDVDRYTQGLMDLGATLCTARAPRCTQCPLAEPCVARRQGDPSRYPVKMHRLERRQRHNALLWLVQGDRLWLVRRPDMGVWAGLWTLPLFDSIDDVSNAAEGWPGRGEALAPIDHALTHFDWRLEPWRHRLPDRLAVARRERIESSLPEGRWFTVAQAQALGLPAPIRKLITR
ncbi:MAG: A/G-specific adenine glycosylase [Aquincola sp.]|nr:A/G-specific adenine glycosylase [Aquincola sp.]MDH5328848.1 A/G-specific adenine glycosylase [Aquincola sp.]